MDHIHVHLHGGYESRHAHPDDDDFEEWTAAERWLANQIKELRSYIMSTVKDQQAQIADLANQLDAAADRIEAKIAEGTETVDLSPIAASVARVTGIVPPPATDPTPAATLYEHTTGNPIDPTYVLADVTLPDGTPLYTFTSDADGSQSGVSADFSVYSGQTIPAAS